MFTPSYKPFLLALIILLGGCNSSESVIQVRAEGKGFYWYFTLAGEDQIFDTADDIKSEKILHLPENSNVHIQVTSQDYLYMFRSPKLAINEVAVPSMFFDVIFIAGQTGKFELEVDPLCGFNFAHDNDVMGHLNITSIENYQTWLASKT